MIGTQDALAWYVGLPILGGCVGFLLGRKTPPSGMVILVLSLVPIAGLALCQKFCHS